MGGSSGTFSRLLREASGWLAKPNAEQLVKVRTLAQGLSDSVPGERRADWQKLLSGFVRDEPLDRRRARVEGLVRACKLFSPKRAPRKTPREIPVAAKPPKSEKEAKKGTQKETKLDPESPVDGLHKIGRAGREALAERGIRTALDLVFTMPVAWDDFRSPLSIAVALEKQADANAARERVCVRATVGGSQIVPMRGRRAVRVALKSDESRGGLILWWFFAAHGILSIAKQGAEVLALGRIQIRDRRAPTMFHPILVADQATARILIPRYGRIGIGNAAMRGAIADALTRLERIPDPVPRTIRAREKMPPLERALRSVHRADTLPPLEDFAIVRERLAWAEAFSRVWDRLLASEEQAKIPAPVIAHDPAMEARLVAELGFALTAGQKKAIREIAADMKSTTPMRRLLLGDVGTGKTAVAFAAAAQVVAGKKPQQVAILAPTSLLAEQYLDACAPLAKATGARIALYTAATPKPNKQRLREEIMSGSIGIVIGTHALLSDALQFDRLGLVIVDEQHRLGVAQRLALVNKGAASHLLTLSATPIPRTLALALRGELRTSMLNERPRGRPPVATELWSMGRWDDAIRELAATCDRGERAFVVSPWIEDDEGAGVLERAEELQKKLSPRKVAVVHGAMPPEQKAKAMRAFRLGDAQILVGTTVIEVGIDVPEATLIIIAGAERFGLAQLHQMRGRVGRGERAGRCILAPDPGCSDLAKERLSQFAALNDGKAIAELDLSLRGAGDLMGTRQSGHVEDFAFLDPNSPPDWLLRLESDVRSIHGTDPELKSEEHKDLAILRQRFALALAVREEAG